MLQKWQDPENPEGMWYGEILFKIVRKMWFANAKDDGIIHSSHFNPIQPETMALVWTAVSYFDLKCRLLFTHLPRRSAALSMSGKTARLYLSTSPHLRTRLRTKSSFVDWILYKAHLMEKMSFKISGLSFGKSRGAYLIGDSNFCSKLAFSPATGSSSGAKIHITPSRKRNIRLPFAMPLLARLESRPNPRRMLQF